MQDLSKILKVKVPPVVILISGLLIIGLLTALSGILHYGNELNNNSETIVSNTLGKPNKLIQNTKNSKDKTNNGQSYTNDSSNNIFSEDSNPTSVQTTNNPTSSKSVNAASGTNISYVKVFLSVNSNPKGSVILKSTANQCDVLRQASADGLISLDMRYNSQLKSYAVYVINGIGNKNSVWWTYTVNAKPPPLGCSYITVHDGDLINWQYIKS